MATKKVTEKILEDAKNEAQEILTKYQKEAEKIKSDYENKIKIKRQELANNIREIKEAEIQRTISTKRLEIKKNLTKEKQKFIEAIIDDALSHLSEHKNYLEFLKELIEKTNEKEGELLLKKQDLTRYSKEIKDFLKKKGLNYKIVTTNEMKGGLIIKKGNITYLGSIDLISEILKNSLAIEISKVLSGGNPSA